MPFRRRRVKRRTMGKEAIKKSATLIVQIGPATTPITSFNLLLTAERSTDGSQESIRDFQNTGILANVGDIFKYVNIRIQTGPQDETPEDDTSGWLEWVIVKSKTGFQGIPNTNIGTQTLGDVATKMFRGDALLNGAIPVGGDQPSVGDIQLKVPDNYIKVQMGHQLQLFVYFRSTNNASTSTTLNDCVLSTQYKLYV